MEVIPHDGHEDTRYGRKRVVEAANGYGSRLAYGDARR